MILLLPVWPDFFSDLSQKLRIIYYLPGNTAGCNDGSKRTSPMTLIKHMKRMNMQDDFSRCSALWWETSR